MLRYHGRKYREATTPASWWDPIQQKLKQDPDYDLQDVFPDIRGSVVDGRLVHDDVPNFNSISSSLTDYTVLKFMREVPLSAFGDDLDLHNRFVGVNDIKRTKELAAAIAESNEITPLIVVVDAEGPYILEGGHRSSALYLLGAKALPAVVVIDEDDF